MTERDFESLSCAVYPLRVIAIGPTKAPLDADLAGFVAWRGIVSLICSDKHRSRPDK
jgi:hypothetical protein